MNIITRRSFLARSTMSGLALAVGSFLNVPGFLQRALAEGSVGLNGKKLLFIFLRGANDGLNSVIPVNDPAYYDPTVRSTLAIPKDPAADYTRTQGAVDAVPSNYAYAINLKNGFAGLHPALRDMVPLYNSGQLALIHRVGYPKQSRSHFDSQRYWESGMPSSRQFREGIFYRVVAESGLISQRTLTAVSVQSNIPLLLRGPLPMTNISSPGRYNMLGVPPDSRQKHLDALSNTYGLPFPEKDNRELVYSLGQQFRQTVDLFKQINFGNNAFYDADGTTHLFPVNAASNQAGVDGGSYGFFQNLKSAAMILANTDAIIAGTEMGGFDTHQGQGGLTGAHPNLIRRIGWGLHALKQFFSNPLYNNGGGGTQGKNLWNDLVVVTLSEFGRTTVQNGSSGTDHAEAGALFVAGGRVRGGTFNCGPTDPVPWVPGRENQSGGVDGSMFAVSKRYLKRCTDYRSVLGEIIRDHLGATDNQLSRIIPGYGMESVEHLRLGGEVTRSSGVDVQDTAITGELNIV